MATTILKTNNYSQFNKLIGNREIHEGHVQKLVDSMKKYYMPVPIVVNAKMEIIEGQHRVEACKRLNLPVFYIIDEKANLKEVHELNKHRRSWNMQDFLRSKMTLYQQNKDPAYKWHYDCFSLWLKSGIRWQRFFYLLGSHASKISSLDQDMHSLPNLEVVKKVLEVYTQIQVMGDANKLFNGKVLRSLYSVIKTNKIGDSQENIKHLIDKFNDYAAHPKFFGKKMSTQAEAVNTWVALYNHKKRDNNRIKNVRL